VNPDVVAERAPVFVSESSVDSDIERYLTRDGIIEKSVALDSLTAPERCLLEMTKEPETVRPGARRRRAPSPRR
jgi:hypothetical protein